MVSKIKIKAVWELTGLPAMVKGRRDGYFKLSEM